MKTTTDSAMQEKKECHGIPSWYYAPDMYGVPDGRRMLSSVKCSCCGKRMQHKEFEQVDCGTKHYYECPNGCSNYTWYDLIPDC